MTETFHGTTILSVRRDGAVALGGDGQVTLGQVVIKATRAQGAPPLSRQGAGRIRRRDRRRVHAVRALRGEARKAPGTPDARGGRAREGLALGSRAAAARGDARDRRSNARRSSSPAPATCSSRSTASSRSARADPMRRPPRKALLDNTTLPAREIVERALADRRRDLHLHESAARHRELDCE